MTLEHRRPELHVKKTTNRLICNQWVSRIAFLFNLGGYLCNHEFNQFMVITGKVC